jgi:predicted glycosyltransferase
MSRSVLEASAGRTGRRYLFTSHDGYGLGHLRRNRIIAGAVLDADAAASVTLVTGVSSTPHWCRHPRIEVVRVPSLVKDSAGRYRSSQLSFDAAVAERARIFEAAVQRQEPDVIVVDRHPFGTAGELRRGLLAAKSAGAALVLGLRDVLDEPAAVAAELTGPQWEGASELFDEVLVYGNRVICDHELEYGLPIVPRYCGWVVDRAARATGRQDDLLLVAAGGGADGADVMRLGLDLLRHRPHLRGVVIAGPFGDRADAVRQATAGGLGGRTQVLGYSNDVTRWLARAGSVLQMAGYNSTVESLAAGHRPMLMPRRTPRREQAIRAGRLAHLGVADVVDRGAQAAELAWTLDRPRRLEPGALSSAGIALDGAQDAACRLVALTAGRRPAHTGDRRTSRAIA